MSTIVIYKSKYGHTLRYAEIIAKKLECEFVDFDEIKKKELLKYDKVVFGSGVYVNKLKKIKKVLKLFKDKPIVIFACGGSNEFSEHESNIFKSNFTEEQLRFHKCFYLPGGLDMNKITGLMKFFMGNFKKILEKKQNKTPDEEGFLFGFNNPTDYVSEEYTLPLVEYVMTQL